MWLFFYLYILLAIIAAFFEVWVWPLGKPDHQAPAGKVMLAWHRSVVSLAQNTPILGAGAAEFISTPVAYGGASDIRLVNFVCGSPASPNCSRNLALGIPDELGRRWVTAVYRYNLADPADARRLVATWVAPPPPSLPPNPPEDGNIYLWGLTQGELLAQLQKAGGQVTTAGIVEAASSANCMRTCGPSDNPSACMPSALRGTSRCVMTKFVTPTGYVPGYGTYIVYPMPSGASAPPVGSVAIISFGG